MAVFLALGLTALGVVTWRLAGRTQPVVRSLVSPPEGGAFYLESGRPGPVAVSPDGARLAFAARDAAKAGKCKDAFALLAKCTGPQQKATAKAVASGCR